MKLTAIDQLILRVLTHLFTVDWLSLKSLLGFCLASRIPHSVCHFSCATDCAFSIYYFSNSSLSTFHFQTGMLIVLIMYRSCVVSCSCCEFMVAVALLCQKAPYCFCPPWPLALRVLCPFFCDGAWAFRRGWDVDVPFVTQSFPGTCPLYLIEFLCWPLSAAQRD